MGNHFRTSSAEPVSNGSAQPSSVGTRFGTSDQVGPMQAQPLQQQQQTSSETADPFAYHSADAVSAAGFVAQTAQQPVVNVPDPAQATTSAQLSGSFAGIPDPAAPAAPAEPTVDADQAEEVASLEQALDNPDFTSVFSPADLKSSRKKMARQAGVEPVVLLEHVTKIYPAQPNKPALDDINIEIYPGEFVFLVGHSGSGKTTLLSTINRDVKPTSGRILVAGQDLMKISNRKVPFLRRQIGAVFQDFKLLPQKTAYQNVAFALQCIGKPRGVIRSQVPEVLRLVGLADQMDSLPDQLSGGEQQRVAVARAMVNRPPLLICDEPTGNLDPAISLGIMKLLERINRTGTTVIVATHDRAMVDSMRRRVIALEAGHVIRDQERGGYGDYGTK